MNTAKLQFNEGVRFSNEIMALMAMPEEEYYQPDLLVGDTVNVFNGDAIVSMTVTCRPDSKNMDYMLMDLCGFFYMASPWRWTEDLGDILKTKTAMQHKRASGYTERCRCDAVRIED